MFDRIAGVYDRMNSVMTAGLHHRWRARAADLARVGPGRPRARRRDRHRRPGDRAGAARRARRRGRRLGLLRGDARARARARRPRRRSRFEWGERAGRCPTPTTRSTPPRSASARATSPTSTRGLARDGARRAARRPRRRARDHDAANARRCRRSSALWFDRVVPLLGPRRGRRATPTRYLPSSVRALPGPAGAGGGDGARGAGATCAGSSPRAGSSRSTSGRAERR